MKEPHVNLDDDTKVWPCPNCGEVLKFLWPPMWSILGKKIKCMCHECKTVMTVGASEALPL